MIMPTRTTLSTLRDIGLEIHGLRRSMTVLSLVQDRDGYAKNTAAQDLIENQPYRNTLREMLIAIPRLRFSLK
jgi:hypothetical protein